jgi:RadC-like JAB domain
MAESNDRGDRETPTVVIAPDSNRANREYEGVVRATLLRFGSPDPDGDLIKTKDYWKHCQSVRIAPEVCGALIYETVRHRHDQTVMLRENVGLMEPTSEKIYKGQLVVVGGEPHVVRKIDGDLITVRNFNTGETYVVTRDAVTPATSASEPSAAAPTDRGQEWEVRVHRHRGYSLAKMKDVAGRKPDEITDRNIIWGEFYDDERAKEFARKLAQGGFIAVYGPRNELYRAGANEKASSKAEDRVGFKGIDVSFAKTEDAEKFMKLIEKQASNIGAFMGGTTHGAIVTTNANDVTIRKVLKKHRWQGAYSVPAELSSAADANECAGDPSAMETIEAVAEPINSNAVPWVKVTRDVDRYSAAMKTADKIGPIKGPREVYDLLGDALNKEDSEVFVVILLDLRGNLRGVCEVARGQRSRVTIGVADVLRPVIASGAEGYIVAHNHPSGKCNPSKADRDLTRLIAEATKPYGKDVCFIDHCVIGIGEVYSICENKCIKM